MGNGRHFAVLVLPAALTESGRWRRALADAGRPPAGAPDTLSETGLYEAGRPGVIDTRNRPFSPQYPLWSDGASKRRWIFMPAGSTIDVTDAYDWDFPVGTKLWKEFAFGGRKVETRFLWKTSATEWAFASYAWNAEGTSATKAPEEGLPRVAEIAPASRTASRRSPNVVPATSRIARRCWASTRCSCPRIAIRMRFMASRSSLTWPRWRRWSDVGRLTPARTDLVAPAAHRGSQCGRAVVLGYLAGNCGVCHNRKTDLAPLGLHWKQGELATAGAEPAVRLLAHRTKWQVQACRKARAC